VTVVVFSLVTCVHAQDWPDKIRGYKVFDADITVTNSIFQKSRSEKADAYLKLTDPTLAQIGLTSATIEIGAELTTTKQNGQVEFVTFHDFMVNGFKVDVEEYKHPFSFRGGEPPHFAKTRPRLAPLHQFATCRL